MVRREQKAVIVHPKYPYTAPAVPALPTAAAVVRHLPGDVLHLIALKLSSPRDLATFGRLCTATRRASLSEDVWHRLCVQKFGNIAPGPPEGSSWREVYRFHHTQFYALARRKPASASFHGLPRTGWAFNISVCSS